MSVAKPIIFPHEKPMGFATLNPSYDWRAAAQGAAGGMRAFIRVAVSLLVAAATAATLFVMGWPILAGYYTQSTDIADWRSWLMAFIVALAYAVVLGLPGYFLVKWLNQTKWWVSLICGFIIGGGPAAIAFAPVPPTDIDLVDYARTVGTMGIFGMVSGFAAWLTWLILGRRMAGPRGAG